MNQAPLPKEAENDGAAVGLLEAPTPSRGDCRSDTVLELSDRYQPSLLRRTLNIDPWNLKRKHVAKRPARATTRKSPQTAFFKLPQITPPTVTPSSPQTINDCRLQLERPDGARLIFTLPMLDASTINLLCSDFLRI
jgi:hypothetical protein